MLELQHDQLRFSFPEITAQLCALTDGHVAGRLPRVLAASRADALAQLFQTQWRQHAGDGAFRERARKKAAAFSAEQLAQAFRRQAFRSAGLPLEENSPTGTDTGLASVGVGFQRTLRIPDDGKNYPLPAGLGPSALRMVDDYTATVPERWRERGGVLMPMYQAEAMWISFNSRQYPFAIKIAAGKINAVNGQNWEAGLRRGPAQDYVTVPGQPWLDGFAVGRGIIRQFVAMPLGGGYSVEEQLTGAAEHGGLQLQAYPLRAEVYFQERMVRRLPSTLAEVLAGLIETPVPARGKKDTVMLSCPPPCAPAAAAKPDLGLGTGGRMKQEIYRDERPLSDWNQGLTSRCFVHLCNSLVWREITRSLPPQPPLTAAEYAKRRLPWFDYYADDLSALPGSHRLAGIKSVGELGKLKGEAPLPGEGPIKVNAAVPIGPARRPGQVREWSGE